MKAFADDKTDVTETLKFVLGRVEKIIGKGENAGYQHFFLFPQCFQKASFSELLKVRIMCGNLRVKGDNEPITKQQIFILIQIESLHNYTDNKINVIKKLTFALERVENIRGKGEKADHQHSLPFPPCFQ